MITAMALPAMLRGNVPNLLREVKVSRQKAPTILDVAAEAGVSKSQVSRALLGQGAVSPDTRERIERAAHKLGYVANAMARGLRSRTHTLGVVLRDVKRPYYAWLLGGMQSRADELGLRIVTTTSASDLEVDDALRALKDLVSLQVDGLLIASARLPSEDIVPYIERVPIVVAGRQETSRGITSVYCDDRDGGHVLAEHLLTLGHRRVAVLLVAEQYSRSQHERGVAMIHTLRAAGAEVHVWEVDSDIDTDRVVSSRLDRSVTAVMCPTDTAAMDVLELMRRRGLRAPEDFAVTGYDGIGPLAAPYLGLTTYRQPVDEIGRMAVNLLVDRIEGRSKQDHLLALRGNVVDGRTAGSPAQVELPTA